MLVVGPAGAGKTRMLAAAVTDLDSRAQPVIGVAPTAKAAHVLALEAGVPADTIAKFLCDLDDPRPTALWRDLGPGTTIIVDEAGMVNTPDLSRLIDHAEQRRWRLALVGDPEQLQAVGRGGMFAELCYTGRTVELGTLHRFDNQWEADVSLLLRAGDPRAIDTYRAHGRIRPGTFDDHLDEIATEWMRAHDAGESMSITTARNEHVAAINENIQSTRLTVGDLDLDTAVRINGATAMTGDVVATRQNDRRLRTTAGDSVRNRERWTVIASHPSGELTVTRLDGHGTITLPTDYTRNHVELAYATTEHGAQGHTADRSITLATTSTTARNLYVAMTRGRTTNHALVVTDTPELAEAISILEAALAVDRADIPATTHRRSLAAGAPSRHPRVPVPSWFEALRSEAQAARHAAQQELDERNTRRAERAARVAAAERDLPAAETAHAPHRMAVAAAEQKRYEAQQAVWRAQADLRGAGRLHRRSARRTLDAATTHLATEERLLEEVDALAEPTRTRVDHLCGIISRARERDATESILDQWDDLDGAAISADDLVHALDRWKHWANGHDITCTELTEIAGVLDDNHATPGVAQLADVLVERERIERHQPDLSPSLEIGLGIDL